MIGGVKPNYESSFLYRGFNFDVHRPVTPNRQKLSTGWQISLDGVPIQLMNLEPKLKAVSQFKHLALEYCPDDAEFKDVVDRTITANRREWNLLS